MLKQQIMKIAGSTALAALLLSSASGVWAQDTSTGTTLPAPPASVATAPLNPPAPGGPLQPGGPRGQGPERPGPEAMANTQEGAVREITHAYRAIAEATSTISTTATIDAVVGEMVTHSKALYAQAYTSYDDQSWYVANETAKAAVSAANVVDHLAQSMNSVDLTVPDLQAPPVITDSTDLTGTMPALDEPQTRSGNELAHSYDAILMAKVTVTANPDLADADFYLTSSETLYKAAYAAYTDEAYSQAAELAHAARSAVEVIMHLKNAATGMQTPGQPITPPEPNF